MNDKDDASPSRKSLAPSVHYPTIYKPTAQEESPLKEGFYQPKPVRPERAQTTTSRPTHAERVYTVQAQRVEDPRVAQEIEAIRQRIQYLTTGRHRSSGLLTRQNQGTRQDMAQTQSLQHIDRLLSIRHSMLAQTRCKRSRPLKDDNTFCNSNTTAEVKFWLLQRVVSAHFFEGPPNENSVVSTKALVFGGHA